MKTSIKIALAATAIAASLTSTASAEPPSTTLIDEQVMSEIHDWLSSPIIAIAVDARNELFGKLAQERIDALDKQWRAERKTTDQPLIAATLGNPLSAYLTQIQAKALGLYSELFVYDRNGLNVGQSAITTDFWQGDEAKFQKSYDAGVGAIFIDEPEYHKGTGTWRAQVNLALTDDAGTKNRGAATIEINLTELARRRALGL